MNNFMVGHAWLIPFIPALSFVVIGLFLARWPKAAGLFSIISIFASFIGSLWLAGLVFTQGHPVTWEFSARWFSMPGLKVEMGLLIDPLSSLMLVIVTLVALLVQVYSWGYMHDDPGFASYYAYQSLFAASMLGLVIANNMIQMFVFWELVGLCSYLLIGFWFGRVSAKNASEKAFITNRVGDFGFLLGILLSQLVLGTVNFAQMESAVQNCSSTGMLVVITLLLLMGPVGKSAQFPLHVWLPDAMEGPTPVSALIHAATMVAAGVYFIARSYVVFSATSGGLLAVAYIGGFTAVFAATIAVAQDDIKRILAYSTLSQLGYMVMAMGVGSLTAGMFHLTTHAFFKALLFLGAGSVIHALNNEQNIWKMGGLFKKMPVTGVTFVIGALALSGIPPFSGFFSKDEILAACLSGGHTGLYLLGTITAFLTAFYMFRLVFVAFGGQGQVKAHESPAVMTVPLVILAIISVGAGALASTFGTYLPTPGSHHEAAGHLVMVISTLVALAGIVLAYQIYGRRAWPRQTIIERFKPVYITLKNKYYVDELYAWLGQHLVQGLAAVLFWFDIKAVNGAVNGIANLTGRGGFRLTRTEVGKAQTYALVMFSGVTLLVLALAAMGW